MRAEAIFVPVATLALWTFAVLFFAGFRRIGATRAGRVKPSAFRLGESADVPADLVVLNRHFMNLLELPVLFYVVTLAFYVTHLGTKDTVALAWSYVLLRFVHSFIHLGANRIVPRLIAFLASDLVLLALWISFLWRVL